MGRMCSRERRRAAWRREVSAQGQQEGGTVRSWRGDDERRRWTASANPPTRWVRGLQQNPWRRVSEQRSCSGRPHIYGRREVFTDPNYPGCILTAWELLSPGIEFKSSYGHIGGIKNAIPSSKNRFRLRNIWAARRQPHPFLYDDVRQTVDAVTTRKPSRAHCSDSIRSLYWATTQQR